MGISYPIRLQGTDGIRRLVKNKEFADPLQTLLQEGFLTPSLARLYSYAAVKYFLPEKKKPLVLVAWDPRDKKEILVDAAIDGLKKADCLVKVLGILPTPAVALALAYFKADLAFMITASHNPAEYNGIKIFIGSAALKPLPEEDLEFSKLIYSLDYRQVCDIKSKGQIVDSYQEARKLFQESLIDSFNKPLPAKDALKDLVIIIDPAFGCNSSLAYEILTQKLACKNVFEVNSYPNGLVNDKSGVAELEGKSLINREMVFSSNGILKNRKTLEEIFNQADSNRTLKVQGLIFDADGDRFYLACYDPEIDKIRIFNGDELAIIQSKLIKDLQPNINNTSPAFVFTVESDLKLVEEAYKLGLTPKQTCVGDKWILREANFLTLQAVLNLLENEVKEKKILEKVQTLKVNLEMSETYFKAQKISSIHSEIETLLSEISSLELNQKVQHAITNNFLIGSEETGHIVTSHFLPNKILPVFIGNGLKSALNSLAASPIKSPLFAPGYKKTQYVFNSSQEKFYNGSEIWRKSKEIIFVESQKIYSAWDLKPELKVWLEEPDMFFVEFQDPKGKLVAYTYIRNSGTERKTGLIWRADPDYKDFCEEISLQLFDFLKTSLGS